MVLRVAKKEMELSIGIRRRVSGSQIPDHRASNREGMGEGFLLKLWVFITGLI